jgi:putative ABC transport system permease protein
MASEAPFGDLDTKMALGPIPMGPHVPSNGVGASWRIVSPEYFGTMRIPLRDGRIFQAGRDPAESLIVSERLANRLWPGRSPVGRRVWLSNGGAFTVVGVVGDVRQVTLDADPPPAIYMPSWWYLWPTMTLVVRSEIEPRALAPAIRGAVLRRDPLQPVAAFQTLEARIGSRAATPRLNAVAAAVFAGLALILAIVGVVGVAGHAVSQRAPELAVRQALGASPRQAVRHVMREGLTLCAAGIAVGLMASLFTGSLLSRVLYGVDAHDPRTFVAVSAVLALAVTVACWLPARRAAAIAPSQLLR